MWTAAAIDQEQNILYNVTGNPKAFPGGPILFTESILAHDLDSGELLWYQQIRPRDPFDLDINTHPVLFDATHPTHRGATVRHCVGAGTKAGGWDGWHQKERDECRWPLLCAGPRDGGDEMENGCLGFEAG